MKKMQIYQPSDNSYFLSEILRNYLKDKKNNIKILDMGSGSGIQAETCRELGFNNILTVDINPEAVNHLKQLGLRSVKSDLFSNIKQKFDLIIFNPPYLPEDKYDKEQDTTAGKKGYETIVRFLKQAKSHLKKEGVILLLFSSLSKPEIILKKAEELGYKCNILNNKKLFFEELYVYELKYNGIKRKI